MSTVRFQHALVTIAIIALIALSACSQRVRQRMVGRQRPPRCGYARGVTLVIFPLLVTMLAYAALQQPLAKLVSLHLPLALLSESPGRVRPAPRRASKLMSEGLFYTPSAHLGVALSVLLVCRIAYRFAVGGFSDPGAGSAATGLRASRP